MSKQFLLILVMVWSVMTARAEDPQKFSPQKFQAEMEQYITTEAGLTTEEAAKFFPLYREMLHKQRCIFNQMRQASKNPLNDEADYRKAVETRDAKELELKKVLQCYHNKFFQVLSAEKVFKVIMAEDKFHRNAFKQWGKRRHKR